MKKESIIFKKNRLLKNKLHEAQGHDLDHYFTKTLSKLKDIFINNYLYTA